MSSNRVRQADRVYRKLLEVDPLHVIDSTDEDNSWDLVYLSRTFSRMPIFTMYFGGGINFSLIEQLRNYGIDNSGLIKPAESYLNGFVVGGNGMIGFELPLIYNFELALEGNFSHRTFDFTDSLYISTNAPNPTLITTTSSDVDPSSTIRYSKLTMRENQFWIDLNLLVKYNLEFKGLLPYIYVGGGPNFLVHANLSDVQRVTTTETFGGGQVIQAPTKPIVLTANGDQPTMRSMLNWSLVAGAGLKFRVGRNFIFVDLRYTRMFLNNIEMNNRYANKELLYKYAHVDNDFRNDNFMLTVGFTKAFYTPRKKRTYNPKVLDSQFDKWLERERNNIKRETDSELRSELNSTIKDLERQKPSLIEDVERGRVGTNILQDKKAEYDKLKNQAGSKIFNN